MRRWLIATALLTIPGLAHAQAPSTFDQYAAASEAFLAGETDISGYFESYREHIFAGIEGTWYAASILQPSGDDDETIAKACERVGVHVTVKDRWTVAFIMNEGKDKQVTTLYTSRGGSTFGQYTDAMELLRRLGLDTMEGMESAVLNALAQNNGFATIVRPSPDILVVQPNLAVPTIYARCPPR